MTGHGTIEFTNINTENLMKAIGAESKGRCSYPQCHKEVCCFECSEQRACHSNKKCFSVNTYRSLKMKGYPERCGLYERG